MLLLGVATAYNTMAEMYFMQACAIVTLIVFWLAFRDGNRYRLLFCVPIAFMVFSLRQYFSMLQGIQIVVTIAQTSAVLAFYCLYLSKQDRFRKFAFPVALASATVASFSFLQGLFVWPAGLIQLIITPMQRSTKRILVGVWTLIGVAEWFLYFFSYTSAGGRSKTYFLLHPIEAVKHVFTLAGGSLLWQVETALIAGVVILGLAAISLLMVYRRRELGEHVFWIGVLTFALGFIFAAMVGRVELGFQQGIASRYVNFSILLPISVYAIIAKLALKRASMPVVSMLIGISLLIVLSIPNSYERGVDEGLALKEERKMDAMVLATYQDRAQPDTLLAMLLEPWRPADKGEYTLAQIKNRIEGRARLLEQRTQLLDRLDYNVFAGSSSSNQIPPPSELSSIDSTTLSNIDRIDGRLANETVVIAKRKVVVSVTGWAVDQRAKEAAGGVYVEVDGSIFPASYGSTEERVAEKFSAPDYAQSGFTARVPVLKLDPGKHELSLIVLTHDKQAYYTIPEAANIVVKNR